MVKVYDEGDFKVYVYSPPRASGSSVSISSISSQNGAGSMGKTTGTSENELNRQNEQAIRAAREADEVEPRATAVTYDPDHALVLVHLRSGFAFGFPPERIPGLGKATMKQLSNVRISPSGDGLHWDGIDVDASVTGLMADALNLREWAPRIMGQVRSEAKAKAARKNGLKGGRPRSSTKRSTSSKRASGE